MCSLQCLVHCLLELGGGVSPRLYMHQTPISGLPTMVKIKLYRNIGIQECSSSYIVHIYQEYRIYSCGWMFVVYREMCGVSSKKMTCSYLFHDFFRHHPLSENSQVFLSLWDVKFTCLFTIIMKDWRGATVNALQRGEKCMLVQ